MDSLIFKGDGNENRVELAIDNNIIWVQYYNIDRTDDKTIVDFCTMLSNAFEKVKEKDKNVSVHRQYISKVDLPELEFLQNDDRWEVIGDDDECLLIECDIDDAAKCIIEAFVGDFLYDEK